MSATRTTSGIGRASAFLASGTIVSRILGFVKAILIVQVIGSSVVGDAFAIGNQLPNTVFTIIAGGVLSAVLVPQIVKAAVHADRGQAYINKLITLTLTILLVTTVVAMIAAPALVNLFAPLFGEEQKTLAIAFALWCLPQLFFYGLYTVLGEILNAHKVFGPFTWSPVLNNVVAIAGLLVFMLMFGSDPLGSWAPGEWSPLMIAVLAGTATLGVAAQALILFAYWKRIDLRFRPDFAWRGVGLGETGKLAGWTFAMILLTTGAGIVQSGVTSSASGGGASTIAFQNAWLVFMLPHSVLAVSLTTAYFTRMAEHAREKDHVALGVDVSAALRNVSLLIVLSAAVMFAVAFPFGRVFASNPFIATGMGWIIVAFTVGLVPFCFLFVVQRTFYALGDTRTPFRFTLFQVIVFCILAATCLLLPDSILAAGVALATSLACIAQVTYALLLLRRRLPELRFGPILRSVVRFTVAAIPTTIVGLVVVMQLGGLNTNGWGMSSIFAALVTMCVAGVACVIVYVAFLWVLGVPELATLAGPARKILGRVSRSAR